MSSILVYSGLDLIGDGLMKLPFLRALRHAYPQARITWLAGIGQTVFARSLRPVTEALIDEVIESAGIGRAWSEVLRRPLPGRRFDLVIDTQRRLKTTLILRRIRHRAFISGTGEFALSSRRPADAAKQPRMIDNMLSLVAAASGKPPCPDAPLVIPPSFIDAAAAVLPAGAIPTLGMAPGAGGVHKRWPLENFFAVARALAGQGWQPVFLLGPDEAGWLQQARDAVPQALFPLQDGHVAPEIRSSPLFTIAVAGRLSLGLANDSGTGHMLAAADIPLVSLFGPTPPAKFAPYVSRGAVMRAQSFGGEAMDAIPAEAVVRQLLALSRPG